MSRPISTMLCAVSLVALMFCCNAAAECPPAGFDLEDLRSLKSAQFRVDDDSSRAALAIGLIDCLAAPQTELRDDIAYSALAGWMRGNALATESLQAIKGRLLEGLVGDDASGFRAPFSALVLSEVARVDRMSPFMDDEERTGLLNAAVHYEQSVDDYRGFIDGEGWRHGVAHGADLLLQLSLNPALDASSAHSILRAVASQVAPSAVSYHFGEEGRLARVVVAVVSRGWLDEAQWTRWFDELATPAPLSSWNDAFSSEAALARLHNLRAFLLALHVRLVGSDSAEAKAAMPGLVRAIQTIP